jgi:hypothetical protein
MSHININADPTPSQTLGMEASPRKRRPDAWQSKRANLQTELAQTQERLPQERNAIGDQEELVVALHLRGVGDGQSNCASCESCKGKKKKAGARGPTRRVGLRIFVFMDLAAPSNSPVKIPAKQRRILLARELCRILPDQPDTGG